MCARKTQKKRYGKKNKVCFLGLVLSLLIGSHASGLSTFTDFNFPGMQLAHNIFSTKNQVPSVLSQRVKALSKSISSENIPGGFTIQLYEPNYILPFFYNAIPSPYYAQHPNSTPDGVSLKKQEFKAQLSLLFPLWENIFGSPISLNASYTQDVFWQVYVQSPYFRETNYEPRLFLSRALGRDFLVAAGFDHQSNGRGGKGKNDMERSWNRVFADLFYSRGRWLVGIEPWVPVLQSVSQDKHNPDIVHYLGYGREIFVYKFHNNQEVSLMLRNVFESNFRRGAVQVSYSFPLHGMLSLYVQAFCGYGQSLIEYDHYTNAIGIGFSFSNWV